MKSSLTWNGLLVTSSFPIYEDMPESEYHGVAYGEPWPLDFLEQPLFKEEIDLNRVVNEITTKYYFADGGYPPSVVPDINIIKRYVARCRQRNISYRSLLCATDSSYPEMDIGVVQSLIQNAKFLGYDYVFSGCDFSGLYDDLHPSEELEDELKQFTPLLNEFGLFDRYSDLEHYIKTRWRIVQEAGEKYVMIDGVRVRQTRLEDYSNFLKCAAYELQDIQIS